MKSGGPSTGGWKNKMMILSMAMILAGVAAAAWGLPAAHRLQGIRGILAAIAVLTGVIIAVLGVLLLVVPGFFEG
jgi:putative effector of murein hydrolase